MAFKGGAIYAEAFIDDKKWKSGLKTLKTGAIATGAAITAAFAKTMADNIRKADQWQKSMTNVSTVIDTSRISTQNLAKELINLDPALGNTKDLTDSLYQSFSAGAESAEQALNTTVTAAKFSTAALTDTATAVDVLTTAVNAYGEETINVETAADVFFKTIESGKITGEQLSSSIGKSIPVFASAGIELEQLTAAMAAMTKQGVNASETTTQLNGIISAFIKPSEDMKKALDNQGFASGSALLQTEGLVGALNFLQTETKGSQEELAKLIPNLEGLRGAMLLTGTGAQTFDDTLVELRNSSGAVNEAFEKQEKTFDTFSSSLDKIQLVTGNIGKHFIDQIATGATAANESILELITSSAGMQFVANAAGAVATGLDWIQAVAGPIADSLFPALHDILKELFTAFGEVFREIYDGGPGVDALAVGVNTVSAAITISSKIVTGFIDNVKNLTLVMVNSGELLGNIFTGQFGKVKDSAEEAWQSLQNFGTGFIDNTAEVVKTAVDEFSNFGLDVQNTINDIELSVTTTFDNVKNEVLFNWEEIYTGFKQTMTEDLPEAMEEGEEELVEKTEETVSKLKAWWDSLWEGNVLTAKKSFDAIVSASSFGYSQLSALSTQHNTNELAKIDLRYIQEQEKLQAQLEQGLITQQEYDDALKKLDEDTAAEKNKLSKKQFDTQKKLDIAGAIIDGASAVLGWWDAATQLGPIAGPIFAGVMTAATTALTAKQVSLISQQEFVPAYQMGGTKRGTGPATIDEEGPELVTLRDGSTVVPARLSQQIANAAGDQRSGDTIINFNDAVVRNDRDIDKIERRVSRIVSKDIRKGA